MENSCGLLKIGIFANILWYCDRQSILILFFVELKFFGREILTRSQHLFKLKKIWEVVLDLFCMLYLSKIFLTIISRLLPQMDFLSNSFVKSLKTPILSSLSFSSSKGLSSFSLLKLSDVLYFSNCSFLSELNDLLGPHLSTSMLV